MITKSKFDTELHTVNINDSLWEIVEPLVYKSVLLNCTITVPVGFRTDFASVPRVPIAYFFYGGRSHREAVIHDYLYRKDSIPVVTVAQADAVFLEAMAARGKGFFVRWPMYLGVRLGGWLLFHTRKVFDKLT